LTHFGKGKQLVARLAVVTFLGVSIGLALSIVLGLQLRYLLVGLFVVLVPLTVQMTGRWKQFFLIALMLGIPLQIKKTIFPYSITHVGGPGGIDVLFADGALIALYLHWALMTITRRQERAIRITGIDLLVALLGAICLLSLVNTKEPTLVLIDLIRVVKVTLLYFYLANNIRTREEIRLVVWSLIAGASIQGCVTLVQAYLGRPIGLHLFGEVLQFGEMSAGVSIYRRPSGLMQSANTLGLYLLCLLPLSLSALFWTGSIFARLFCLGTFAAGTMALIITYSRGSWLGFIFGSLVFFLWLLRKKLITYRRHFHLLALFALLVMMILVIMWPKIMDRLLHTPSIPIHTRTFLTRLCLKVCATHPLLGVGLNTSAETATRMILTVRDPHNIIDYVMANPLVHNLYLLMLSEIGLLGLSVFLCLLVALFRQALKAIQIQDRLAMSVGVAIYSALSGFLVAELFDFSYRLDQVFYLFWALSGLIVAINRRQTHLDSTASTDAEEQYAVTPSG